MFTNDRHPSGGYYVENTKLLIANNHRTYFSHTLPYHSFTNSPYFSLQMPNKKLYQRSVRETIT